MASENEAAEALLDAIVAQTAEAQRLTNIASRAKALLHLSEAFAWAVRPGQPHGGAGGTD
jgi:hypothetical protein